MNIHLDWSPAKIGSTYFSNWGMTSNAVDRSVPRLIIKANTRRRRIWAALVAALPVAIVTLAVLGRSSRLGSFLAFAAGMTILSTPALALLAHRFAPLTRSEVLEIDQSYVTLTRGGSVSAWTTSAFASGMVERQQMRGWLNPAVAWNLEDPIHQGWFGRDLSLTEGTAIVEQIRGFLRDYPPHVARPIDVDSTPIQIQR